MNIKDYIKIEGEKPLDRILPDGGFTNIFRTIGCIGDSLSSGEFEAYSKEKEKKTYHDRYEYSWGQFIARMTGSTVYNFSKGGMTAKEYVESFANSKGFWDNDKLCRAYIIALGVNDVINRSDPPMGSADEITPENWKNHPYTVIGYYSYIIGRLKSMQPKARFFLVSMPRSDDPERNEKSRLYRDELKKLCDKFEYTYLIDLFEYAPVYDREFKDNFYLGNHLSATGYALTAKMIASYIDYIIRNNPDDFRQIGFVGGEVHNELYKW